MNWLNYEPWGKEELCELWTCWNMNWMNYELFEIWTNWEKKWWKYDLAELHHKEYVFI